MANSILVGAQWGDEGKGKIIDFLTEKADIVGAKDAGSLAIRFDAFLPWAESASRADAVAKTFDELRAQLMGALGL